MAVDVWDADGQAVIGQAGELVCTKPFPACPLPAFGMTPTVRSIANTSNTGRECGVMAIGLRSLRTMA